MRHQRTQPPGRVGVTRPTASGTAAGPAAVSPGTHDGMPRPRSRRRRPCRQAPIELGDPRSVPGRDGCSAHDLVVAGPRRAPARPAKQLDPGWSSASTTSPGRRAIRLCSYELDQGGPGRRRSPTTRSTSTKGHRSPQVSPLAAPETRRPSWCSAPPRRRRSAASATGPVDTASTHAVRSTAVGRRTTGRISTIRSRLDVRAGRSRR